MAAVIFLLSVYLKMHSFAQAFLGWYDGVSADGG